MKEALISLLVVLIPSFLTLSLRCGKSDQDKSRNVNGWNLYLHCVNQHNDKHWEIKTQNNGFMRGKKRSKDISHFLLLGPRLFNTQTVLSCSAKTFYLTDFGRQENILFVYLGRRRMKEKSGFIFFSFSGHCEWKEIV